MSQTDELTSKPINHLGIPAGLIDKFKLVERLDARLPISEEQNSFVTHGQRIKAMILNGLGFTQSPLYLTPEFFEDKPVELLIGKGVKAQHLNDDALGRTLDKCYEYGVMPLFAEIANEVYLDVFGIEQKQRVHIDTTSIALCGDYAITTEYPEDKTQPALPKFGYSKDHRPDLKQVMMSLTVGGPADMPIWFEALDGNSQDKTNFHNTLNYIKAFREQLKAAPDLTVVADSALYVNEKLKEACYLWITRIPNSVKSIKYLTQADSELFNWQEIDEDNQAVWLGQTERELAQCNLMVYSKQAAAKQIITFECHIKNENEAITKAAKKLSNECFFSEADANQAIDKLSKKLKYHDIDYLLTEVKKFSGKGRPKKDVLPEFSHYQVEITLVGSEEKQRPYRNKLGRFVLATNDYEIEPKAFLSTYKAQQNVERGFKFIKDPVFHLGNIFLKRPERINALLMVMTFCLMIYNLGQYQIREALKEKDETILSQTKKPTKTPTLRWIFQRMNGISLVMFPGQGEYITGLTPEKIKILKLLGSEITNIYRVA